MLESMVLNWVLGEVGGLENAMKTLSAEWLVKTEKGGMF
jgi:hypothetical protein